MKKIWLLLIPLIALLFTGEPYYSFLKGEMELLFFQKPFENPSWNHLEVCDADVILLDEDILQPVALALTSNHDLLVANYKELYHVDLLDGSVTTLVPPKEVEVWCPTGLCFDGEKLYVANYKGNNVLVFSLENNTLQYNGSITHPSLVAPENIAAAKETLFVADYDGHALHAFDKATGDRLWCRSIPYCHGVTTDGEFVYATGVKHRVLHKYDLKGNHFGHHSQMGWQEGAFLFPVSVSLQGDKLVVADSHTGRITFFEKGYLRPVGSFGGNGPGADLFHMPYALIPAGNHLLIADTFKRRILLTTHDGGVIKTWQHKEVPHSLQHRPLGKGYIRYVNPQSTFTFGGERWYTGFAGLGLQGLHSTSMFHPRFLQLRSKSGPLFNSSTYFTYTMPFKGYQILGATEWGFVLFDDKGVVIPIRGHYYVEENRLLDLWGFEVDIESLLSEAKTISEIPSEEDSYFFPHFSTRL